MLCLVLIVVDLVCCVGVCRVVVLRGLVLVKSF